VYSRARNLDAAVRRLFSTFALGAPGLGLLLLRVVAGIALVFHAAMALRGDPPVGSTMLYVITGAVGILLLVGLWTPIAGTLLAILASWSAFLHPADPLSWVLLGVLGAALALLGPGGWSVDAYLFGWKRVELPDLRS
jgi:putative oxidoreductase